MDTFVIAMGVVLCLMVLACLYRVVGGPTILDRIVAVGTIGNKTSVLLLFMGIIYHRLEMFVDIALTYALLNFIATIGAAKYFRVRKSIIPGAKYLKERRTS